MKNKNNEQNTNTTTLIFYSYPHKYKCTQCGYVQSHKAKTCPHCHKTVNTIKVY